MFFRVRFWVKAIMVLNATLFLSTATAQEYTAEQLEAFFAESASNYEFRTNDAEPRLFVLREQPILKWTNPVRHQNKGSLFVWTDDGRPAVLASIFSFSFSGFVQYRHEVYSLVDEPMEVTLDERVVWEPKRTDASWKSIEGEPAKKANRRLTQMRAIARSFAGKVGSKRGSETTQLKLMPQPLLRYESIKHRVVDAGVFGLAIATDPEAYLLLEAYRTSSETADDTAQLSWRYTLVPSTYLEVTISRNGEQVWKHDKNMALEMAREGAMPLASEPYFTFFERRRSPPPPEELQELVDQKAETRERGQTKSIK